ncbi:MAG: GH3 auxin-responsive promoter family protein [Dehalococcoidales bacterium]|nr:GH3 auxin-responsive promoter family protein [Dehalococcoidales bacterium]
MRNIQYPMIRSESDRVWTKYCGFLDLMLPQFMAIQKSLMLQQLERMVPCKLGEKLLGKHPPHTIEEFRDTVSLTTYADYLPELEPGLENALPAKTFVWAQTAGDSNSFHQIPYTEEAYGKSLDNLMAVFILACSKHHGQSSFSEGDRVLFDVAPKPYLSGILASGAAELFNLHAVMPPDAHDSMDFKEKTARGFEKSLRTGVDIIFAMTSVLVKTGNDFNRLSRKGMLSRRLLHPAVMARLGAAYLRSQWQKRKILPKDVWPVKALIGWGTDTSLYREQLYRNWGAYPYEFHACSEAGIIAVQTWTRKDMTFIPFSGFYEFIPESECLKSRNDLFYQPSTVLLSEVIPGERYELVISSFYGMPFLRYRTGHLVRITSFADEGAGVHLPQTVFETCADDLIDIASNRETVRCN